MDHENNAQLDNVVMKCANLMDGMQPGDTAMEEIVGMGGNNGSGGKFEEREDDGEYIKYINEVQQSEKHQMSVEKVYVDGDNHDALGNGNSHVEREEQICYGFGDVEAKSSAVDFISAGFVEEEKPNIRDDTDFTTSIGDLDEINMKGLTMKQPADDFMESTTQQQEQHDHQTLNIIDEQIQSSFLATNGINTHGEASSAVIPYEANDDKENRNPQGFHLDLQQLEQNDDDHQASPLNPDAIEFVPRFGTNTVSSSSLRDPREFGIDESTDMISQTVGSDAGEGVVPHPNALPRHILQVDDDFVAQSPRKGSRVYNMDSISLPGECEFDHGADCRPHELCENKGEDISTEPVQPTISDKTDFQIGPETSVDLDVDIEESLSMGASSVEDLKKQSIHIYDILNSVQPLPVDGEVLNESFSEKLSTKGQPEEEVEPLAVKELLSVEEKEFISHSPSTEEIKIPMDFHTASSEKDIPKIPIDMDFSVDMQESFYAEQTSSEIQQFFRTPGNEECLLSDTVIPLESSLTASYVDPAEGGPTMPFNLLGVAETPGNTMDHKTEPFSSTITHGDFADLGKKMDELNLSNDNVNGCQVEQFVEVTAAGVTDHQNSFIANTGPPINDPTSDQFQKQHFSMASNKNPLFKNELNIESSIEQDFDLKKLEPQEEKQDFNKQIELVEPKESVVELNIERSIEQDVDLKKLEQQEEKQEFNKQIKLVEPKESPVDKQALVSELNLKPMSVMAEEDSVLVSVKEAHVIDEVQQQAPTKKNSTSVKTATSSRTRLSDVGTKKPLCDTKKPTITSKTSTNISRPRTAAVAKTSTAAKPPAASLTASRKPAGCAPTVGNKSSVVSKISTGSTSSRVSTTAPKLSVGSSTVRKTVPLRSTVSSRSSVTSTAPKQHPATAPSHPTTLGVSGALSGTKPKMSSPRSTLSSQLRKPVPTTKTFSPVKPLSAVNESGKTTSSTSSSARAKTTGVKPPTTRTNAFPARAAPKLTTNSTTVTGVTARRLASTSSSTITTGTTAAALKRSPLSMTKTPLSTGSDTGKLSLSKSPTDRYTVTTANKAKECAVRKPMEPTRHAIKKQIAIATKEQPVKNNGRDMKSDNPLQLTEILTETTSEMSVEFSEEHKDIGTRFENGVCDAIKGNSLV